MKIAIIDKKNITLSVGKDTFKVEEQSIPFRLVDLVVLNHKITLSSADVLKFAKEEIALLFVSSKSDNLVLLQSANAKGSELKQAQYQALEHRLVHAKHFVREKVKSHQAQLEKHKIVIDISDVLEQIEKAKEVESLMGIEGTFARFYFGHYFSLFSETLHKGKRSKKPPKDPLNAMLSYVYMFYYHLISAKLLSYGFELGIAYLHTPFRTHNALSSDFMELFRAEINELVFEIFDEKLLDLDDFSFKGAVYLRFEGRKKVWRKLLELNTRLKPKLDEAIAKFRGDINETKFNY